MKFFTRIAPSPTGPTHLGTMRTAYFNWLAARASGGKFFVRIDDTDLERSEQRWADQFLKSLEWLGLDWDGLDYQSKRMEHYDAAVSFLVDSGKAVRDGKRVHLNLVGDFLSRSYWVDDIAGNIPIRADNVRGFDNLTLIKSDGSPTYHFASVVDDIEMDINHIIRGVDHITNTAKQVLLYDLLGGVLPKYSHVGLLRHQGKKLSKREQASTFQLYIDSGYDPDAMLNFLARLGWGPSKDDKTTKILTKDRMIELFLSGGTMKSKDANLDLRQLESYDRKYKGRKDRMVRGQLETNE